MDMNLYSSKLPSCVCILHFYLSLLLLLYVVNCTVLSNGFSETSMSAEAVLSRFSMKRYKPNTKHDDETKRSTAKKKNK